MKRINQRLHWMVAVAATLLAGPLAAGALQAQGTPAATVPVIMLSDIHFDPFHDPAKLAALRSSPVSKWASELSKPDAPTQAADVAALQAKCPVRGVDTPWTLLQRSLKAAHAQQRRPVFVTMSGDLLAHGFDCRFKALAPAAGDAAYSDFAARTAAFIALELRETFPGTPVYLTLGNNDSGCGDYREAAGSAFLHSIALSFADDVGARNRKAVLAEASEFGDYNVQLPAPMQHARLIVLQDLFESSKYKGCKGAPDANVSAASIQMDWLRKQLAAAQTAHEHVWVMAHIPPGVDVYSTFAKNDDVCGGQAPEMFLGSEKLVEVLTEFGTEIKLVILAHTHMDEMRLLLPAADGGAPVPAKLVPSISPVNGNNPSFTVAEVDAPSAKLVDYAIYAAGDATGAGVWSKEYSFGGTYQLPDYSAQSLGTLFTGFRADKTGSSALSQAYVKNFFVGGNALKAMALQLAWPSYACSLTQNTAEGYRSCSCAAKK